MKTRRITPWLYILPTCILVIVYLVYPTVHTLILSFFNRDSSEFIGVNNYIHIVSNKMTVSAIKNNLLWMSIFPLATVSLGLFLAIRTDDMRYEKLLKSVIFLPMAISFVGAGVIWKFMYAYRPVGISQIGLLNEIVVAVGGHPIAWLTQRPWMNNLCLLVIGIWVWTGFCMVILSAAYKNLPSDVMDAAKVDGATEWQIFSRIVVRLLQPTLVMVTTIMMVFGLKIFDVIYVTTNGLFNTEVLANRMYKELFIYHNIGRASAIAIILLVISVGILGTNILRSRNSTE